MGWEGSALIKLCKLYHINPLGLLDNELLSVSWKHCGLQFFLDSVGWTHVDQDIPELV